MDNAGRATGGLPSLSGLVRHHPVLILFMMTLMTALAGVYVTSQTSTYTSSSRILLSPAPNNPLTPQTASGGSTQLTVAMETESQLATTAAVQEIVSEELGRAVPDPNERLGVQVPANTQMLQFDFTSGSAEAARAGAQGFAEAYLQYRAERAQSSQDATITALERQIETVRDNLAAATAAARENDAAVAASEVQLFADRLAQLTNSLSAAETVSTDPGAVITAAEAPTTSNELPAWMLYAAGALAGLVIGLALAFVLQWRRDLIRDSNIADQLGIPVLAELPTETGLEGSALEAYRKLRTAVIANAPAAHVLGITGVGTAHAARAARNLAQVLTQAKFSVLIIDADTGGDELSRLLRIPAGTRGLAEAVHRSAHNAAELTVERHRFEVLATGKATDDLDSITASPHFRTVVERARQHYDYVLLLTDAAGSASAETALLAADSVLLTVVPDQTTTARARATLGRFSALGIRALGLALQGRASGEPDDHDEDGDGTPADPEMDSTSDASDDLDEKSSRLRARP